MKKIRTRFAPSPTGYLHIGSLRTVLFAYLIAKAEGGDDGKLILRIEDTDQKREVPGAVDNLIEIINWVGIKFDEGPHIGGNFGPYVQSQRIEIYREYTQKLLETGQAYRCFCSPERLQKMREEQQANKLPPRYDRCCRDLSDDEINEKLNKGEKYVIRQKMPLEGDVKVIDELRGEITFKAEDLEDHVLVKSDGMPTYQFANVVDDHLMEITHVLRGEEWIPSFPKNVLLYKIFGWEPPKFVHLPLTLNKGGGKLSKRQGDVSVEDYKIKGYLPEALINFSALSGWHPKGDNEIFSLKEVEKEFKIKDMGTSPAIFDIEKLDYLNGYYIRQKSLDELVELCKPYLEDNLEKSSEDYKKSNDFIKKVVGVEQERLKKLSEIGELTEFFFVDNLEYDASLLAWKKMSVEEAKNNLSALKKILDDIEEKDWQEKKIEEKIIGYLQKNNLKVGEYLWPMRVALTGRKASPGPFEVAAILGKKESLERIDRAVNVC